MPNWKKVIISGSNAALNDITASGAVTIQNGLTVTGSAEITGSLTVDGAIYTTLIEAASGSDGTTSSGASITIKGQDSTPDDGAGGNVYIYGGVGAPQGIGTIYIGNTVSNVNTSYFNRLQGSTQVHATGPNTGTVFRVLAGVGGSSSPSFQVSYDNLTNITTWTTNRNLEIVGGSSYTFDNNTTISGSLTVSQSVSASTYYGDGSNLTGIETGSWDGIFTGSAEITGSLEINNTLFTTISSSVSSGTTTLYTFTDYEATHAEYKVKNGANLRTGTVIGCWDNSNVDYTETSINGLGDTSDVSFAFTSTGQLQITTSGTYEVKVTARAL